MRPKFVRDQNTETFYLAQIIDAVLTIKQAKIQRSRSHPSPPKGIGSFQEWEMEADRFTSTSWPHLPWLFHQAHSSSILHKSLLAAAWQVRHQHSNPKGLHKMTHNSSSPWNLGWGFRMTIFYLLWSLLFLPRFSMWRCSKLPSLSIHRTSISW